LIDPFGRYARDRSQVEQLFTEEQQGPMKQSRHQLNITAVRTASGDVALVDADCTLTGMRDAAGKELPVFKPHVFFLMGRKDGNWAILAARPYAFVPRPGSVQ
jgi:ketosteroid isomerase-like protein